MEKLSYKKMVLDSMAPQKADANTIHTLDITDDFIEQARQHHPEHVEKFLIQISGSINGCHFTKETAEWAVCKMVPVGMTTEIFKINLKSPDDVENLIRSAFSRARTKAREKGISAPEISSEYNNWDMYVTYAMILADFWVMDMTTDFAADMAYCYLSDPDYPTHTKIWDYLMR